MDHNLLGAVPLRTESMASYPSVGLVGDIVLTTIKTASQSLQKYQLHLPYFELAVCRSCTTCSFQRRPSQQATRSLVVGTNQIRDQNFKLVQVCWGKGWGVHTIDTFTKRSDWNIYEGLRLPPSAPRGCMLVRSWWHNRGKLVFVTTVVYCIYPSKRAKQTI